MDNDRLLHSLAVARKMVEIGKTKGLSIQEQQDLFLIGFNHDIGYEYSNNGFEHNKIGGEILKNNGFKYWQEIYYHSEIDCQYKSHYLNILNQADMQIDKKGNDVGYTKRLEDIKTRYGQESLVYQKCLLLVEQCKENNINN